MTPFLLLVLTSSHHTTRAKVRGFELLQERGAAVRPTKSSRFEMASCRVAIKEAFRYRETRAYKYLRCACEAKNEASSEAD